MGSARNHERRVVNFDGPIRHPPCNDPVWEAAIFHAPRSPGNAVKPICGLHTPQLWHLTGARAQIQRENLQLSAGIEALADGTSNSACRQKARVFTRRAPCHSGAARYRRNLWRHARGLNLRRARSCAACKDAKFQRLFREVIKMPVLVAAHLLGVPGVPQARGLAYLCSSAGTSIKKGMQRTWRIRGVTCNRGATYYYSLDH